MEDQAQHYEGKISHLKVELTTQQVDERKFSDEEIQIIKTLQNIIKNLGKVVDCFHRELLEEQYRESVLRTTSQRLLREQAEKQELLGKARVEATREHKEGKEQVEELEYQIRDLTANLRIMQQFAQDEELSNAQIFGTTSKTSKRGKKVRRPRR